MIHVTAITPSVHCTIGNHGIAKSNSTGDEKARYSKYDPSIPRGTPMTRDLTEHSMLSRVNIRFSPAGVMPTLRKAANSRARKSTLVDMVLITFVSPISVSMVTKPYINTKIKRVMSRIAKGNSSPLFTSIYSELHSNAIDS